MLTGDWKLTTVELLPEERLLFALAHIHPSPDDRLCAAEIFALPGFSWDRAWTLASRQWVHPILAKNIQDDSGLLHRVPDPLRPLLNLARFSARVRQAAYEESLGPVFAELAGGGVQVALMKGAAMLSRYPAETRLLNDVDILIRESDGLSVTDALEASGFRKLSVEAHQLTFARRAGGMTLSIDVHWSLHDRHEPFSVDPAGVISRARPVRFGAASIRALSSEDTLLNYRMQLIADDLTGAHAADRDLALAGPEVGDDEARHVARQIHDVLASRLAHLFRGDRGDGKWNLLDGAVAFGRRDDNLTDDVRLARRLFRRDGSDRQSGD